jgi:hypothetical protein
MPPRPPPSPPVLTVLCSFAAVVSVWITIAVDQLVRGLVGSLAGVPFRGLEISADGRWTVVALQGPTASLGPWGWVAMLLSGPLVALFLAMALLALVGAMRSPGWLRGLSLAWFVVALLWLPIALASAALPIPGGPVAELYAHLGDPRAGRWTAVALAVVMIVVLGGAIARRAVAIGRSWIRADGVEFRRRLVRVTAGWPGATAVAALAYGAGWAPTAWALMICAGVMVVLQLRTA